MNTRGQVTGTSHSDSHSRLWMTVGRLVSAKFASITWRSEWTPRLEKFSKNALWASSSQNRRERGGIRRRKGTGMKRVLGRSGFTLRCHRHNYRKQKERERKKDNQKSPKQFKYNKYIEKRVCMHGKCMNMWHAKQKASWAQPNPNLSAHKHIAHI